VTAATDIPRTANRPGGRPAAPPRRAGFTLVELMTAITIIAVLLGIILPSLMQIKTQIKRSASLATVRLIDSACEAYYNDFEDYPPSRRPNFATYLPNWEGKYLLPLLLTGYAPDPGVAGEPFSGGRKMHEDDGKDEYGYRVVHRGVVYGPYNGTEEVELRRAEEDDPRRAFVDAFGNQVFYYKFRSDAPGSDPKFHEDDNGPDPNSPYEEARQPDMPDYAVTATAEADWFRRDFLLCTMGPDQRFEAFRDDPATDDVTNFLQEQ
jgi:prepilin-type N-terminal cleavage/methylation domain-containing protein